MNLIPNLINHFLFPASRLVKKLNTTPDLQYNDELASGICSSPDSIQACYKLLNALCVGVKENIEILSELISDIFYNDEPPLVEWEYYPHVGPRPTRGLEGQQVNLREQHDAFEFFNTLVDSVDEGLKAYNATPIISKVLGGSFADQKICKGCPHR
uniref:USP domain-containing protein n=1 Tax=Amphimedon queenslandica TaxID=400682 RepID=A0A1X7T6Z7_AMPQE